MSTKQESKEEEEKKKGNEEEKKEEKVDPFKSELSVADILGDEMYPCMVSMLGSAFGFMKIEKDGSYSCPDVNYRGGRTLLGLGSLLLKAKTYSEIVDLAVKGNEYAVTTSTKGFETEKAAEPGEENPEDNSVYGKFDEMEERPCFIFGNAVGKDISDFKREDIAAALVNMSVMETVQMMHKTCTETGCKHVFIAGSYCDHPYIKKKFTLEWMTREQDQELFSGINKKVDHHFMSQGSHLGALGALINNVEHFIGNDGTLAAGAVGAEQGKGKSTSEGQDESNSDENKTEA